MAYRSHLRRRKDTNQLRRRSQINEKKKKIYRRHCGVNHDDSIAITCHVRSCPREAKSKEKNAIARSSWSKRGRQGRLNVVQLLENIFSVSRSSFLRISSYYQSHLLPLGVERVECFRREQRSGRKEVSQYSAAVEVRSMPIRQGYGVSLKNKPSQNFSNALI